MHGVNATSNPTGTSPRDLPRRARARRRIGLTLVVLAAALVALQTWRMLGGPGEAKAPVPGVPLRLHPRSGPSRAVTVVFLSSDADWLGINKNLPRALAEQGYPTVAWNSLRYYLRERSPESAAADLSRVLDEAARRYGSRRFALVGYSWGAGVLPFLVNRLPEEQRQDVVAAVYLAYPGFGAFRFRPSAWWLQVDGSERPAEREVARLGLLPSLCIAGEQDPIRDCRSLAPHGVPHRLFPVGHSLTGLTAELLPWVQATIERGAAERGTDLGGAATPGRPDARPGMR